ncbi:hypothetical protein AQUCO_00200249v1 [Aquilegia coerulea]|uniref:Uncharacterized protein n=1 Tax=Aquilegia coerulea TaxID=218851 RepID=A0A2G5F2C8_AQUCA|nr:hypothetical protein AQUCO_00200249v1 [Aquilegia coerulea]
MVHTPGKRKKTRFNLAYRRYWGKKESYISKLLNYINTKKIEYMVRQKIYWIEPMSERWEQLIIGMMEKTPVAKGLTFI